MKKIMPGGSVANSLYTLSQFDIPTSFIGKIADDETGNTFKSVLQGVGMNVQTKQVNEGITGECLVLISLIMRENNVYSSRRLIEFKR